MGENIVQEKSYKFALKVIKLYKFFADKKKENDLSKQILRSGTSIGANVEEGIGGITKNDFINIFYIAHKEARGTNYWIRLLADSGYITQIDGKSLLSDCYELIKLKGKIISTAKKNRN